MWRHEGSRAAVNHAALNHRKVLRAIIGISWCGLLLLTGCDRIGAEATDTGEDIVMKPALAHRTERPIIDSLAPQTVEKATFAMG
jgi:hypothetical protein